MSFIKKVLVLKQIESGFSAGGKPVSGICRIEKEDGVAELHLTVVNCAPTDGEFYLFIADDKKNLHSFCLGKRITALSQTFLKPIDPERGFAVGLCAIKDDIPLTVAFASDQRFDYSLSLFKKAVADYCYDLRRQKTKKTNLPETEPNSSPDIDFPSPSPIKPVYPPAKEPDPTVTPEEEFPSPKSCSNTYDDEAVATENYYQKDLSIKEKLTAFKELDYGCVRLEDDPTFNTSKNQTDKIPKNAYKFSYETDVDYRRATKSQPTYYQSVRKELNAIFEKFPSENGLEQIFSDSKFAKIRYSEDKFYVVGLIKNEGVEKYICYGVPGKYSPEPPPQLKGYCTFIPLSIFDLVGNGYWMMFQDAHSGKCLSLNIA